MGPAMDNTAARQRLFAGLAFSGEITASVTHELNNVLGTIEQVTGLIEDLADTDAVRQAGISDKLLDVVGRVTKQTVRGTALINHLNGFAHLSDNAAAECDLGELVQRMAVLSARFAKMRKVQLATTLPDQSITIRSSPFEVTQAIFGGIKRALQMAKPPEPIKIGLSPYEGSGLLIIDVQSDEESARGTVGESVNKPSGSRPDYSEESLGDGHYRIRVLLRADS
ncbi:MAG: hypothetical protein ABIE70_02095 [bacterium]